MPTAANVETIAKTPDSIPAGAPQSGGALATMPSSRPLLNAFADGLGGAGGALRTEPERRTILEWLACIAAVAACAALAFLLGWLVVPPEHAPQPLAVPHKVDMGDTGRPR